MDETKGRHVFPDINPGGKGGSISVILLLEVGGNKSPMGGLQENNVLLLIINPGATQVLLTLLQFQYIHILTKSHTNGGIPNISPPLIPQRVQ